MKTRFFFTVLAVLVGLTMSIVAQEEVPGSEDRLITMFQAYLDAWLNDTSAFPDYLAEDVTRHHLFGPNMEVGELREQHGMDEIAEDAAGFHAEMPGAGIVINYSVEHDNYLWVAQSLTDVPGEDEMVISFVLLARFEDDLIAEIWVADDELAMLSLLDALPTMAMEE